MFVLSLLGFEFSQIKLNITATPGISFFIFASVSYIVDVYYRRIEPSSSLKDYALFLSFFPKFLSGPIARVVDFLQQLKQHFRLTAIDIETVLSYILLGTVKKISDYGSGCDSCQQNFLCAN